MTPDRPSRTPESADCDAEADTSRDARRRERRTQLLAAAVDAIRTIGSGATMEQLAKAGGVTKPILYRHFGDRAQVGFGIGTHLSNDLGLPTLNIVMKLVRCNGQPVAKLADSPGKTMCDDQTFLAYLRQVFRVPA